MSESAKELRQFCSRLIANFKCGYGPTVSELELLLGERDAELVKDSVRAAVLAESEWWANHDIEDYDTQSQWDGIAAERVESHRASGADPLARIREEARRGAERELWPRCVWCRELLERFAKAAGKCPQCGALVFPLDAPSSSRLKALSKEVAYGKMD